MKDTTKAGPLLTQLSQIATKLSDMLRLSDAKVQLSSYQTADGVTIEINDETLEPQGEVQDGEYPLEDGRILVITDGKLGTFKDAPAPEEVKQAEEPTAPEVTPEVEALVAENEALKAKISELESALNEASLSKEELATKLSALEAEPAAKKINLAAQSAPASKSFGATLTASLGIRK